jgi:hypothetical protein
MMIFIDNINYYPESMITKEDFLFTYNENNGHISFLITPSLPDIPEGNLYILLHD